MVYLLSRFFMSAQKHKIVLVLCVVTWAGIFFLSGTLFVGKRYDIGMANKVGVNL